MGSFEGAVSHRGELRHRSWVYFPYSGQKSLPIPLPMGVLPLLEQGPRIERELTEGMKPPNRRMGGQRQRE